MRFLSRAAAQGVAHFSSISATWPANKVTREKVETIKFLANAKKQISLLAKKKSYSAFISYSKLFAEKVYQAIKSIVAKIRGRGESGRERVKSRHCLRATFLANLANVACLGLWACCHYEITAQESQGSRLMNAARAEQEEREELQMDESKSSHTYAWQLLSSLPLSMLSLLLLHSHCT